MRAVSSHIARLALILTACSSDGALSTPTLESTAPPPSPTLRPAPTYVEGHAEIPVGKRLFVEYYVVNGGTSPTGQCPDAAMIDFPGYSFSDGVLRAMPGPLPIGEGIIGYAAFGVANSGAMGGGASSSVEPITALPFSLPYDVAIIHALEASGEIVAEIGGAEYWMGPGEAWVRADEWDPTPDCHRTSAIRFTNYGLLDGNQIEAE